MVEQAAYALKAGAPELKRWLLPDVIPQPPKNIISMCSKC